MISEIDYTKPAIRETRVNWETVHYARLISCSADTRSMVVPVFVPEPTDIERLVEYAKKEGWI